MCDFNICIYSEISIGDRLYMSIDVFSWAEVQNQVLCLRYTDNGKGDVSWGSFYCLGW